MEEKISSRNKLKKLLKILFIALLLLYCIVLIVKIAKHREVYQWDFKAHFYAARAHAAGLNPYDRPLVRRVAKAPLSQWFNYTPVAIWFYRLFCLFDFNTAYYLFLAFKCILLVGLLYLWRKGFLKSERGLLFYLFCLLAFNSAIYIDFLAGNISILEQFGLWLAFYFFLRRRLLLFCLIIVILANFKLTPLLFLFLLWFLEEKKKYIYFLGSAILFAGIQLISYLTSPLFMDFVRLMSGILSDIRGVINPSTFTLIRDVFGLIAKERGITVPQRIQILAFLVIVAAIIFLSWRSFIVLKSVGGKEKDKIMVFLSCLVYALILPRFKDYSYILLIVPTYFAIKRFSGGKEYIFLFIIMVLSTPDIVNLPGFNIIFSYLWNYYPLAIAFSVWILYLSKIFLSTKKELTAN